VTLARWVCPKCTAGTLAPSRPRRDDVRRYCLPCSSKTGRLVERESPARARLRDKAKERSTKKRRKLYTWKPRAADYYRIGGSAVPNQVAGWPVRVRTTRGPGPVRLSVAGKGTSLRCLVLLRKGAWADRFDAKAQIAVALALLRVRNNAAARQARGHGPDSHESIRGHLRAYITDECGVRPKLKNLSQATVEVARLLRSLAAVNMLGHDACRHLRTHRGVCQHCGAVRQPDGTFLDP